MKRFGMFRALAVAFTIAVLAATVGPTVTHAAVTRITIVNETDEEVYSLYARLSGRSAWGRDLLGMATIPAGESFRLRLTSGTYDVKAVSRDGTIIADLYNLTLDSAYTWSIAPRVSYSLTNYQEEEICYVYTAISGSDAEWGPDLLGSETIDVGETWTTTVVPEFYDMQLVGCSGDILDVTYEMDLTDHSSWTTP